jgi:chromosome partitioning protein
MRLIAWISEKGGAAKTTSAINTAVGLAKLGNRTLLVDTDPQANASLVMLEGNPAESPTLANVLLGQADAHEAIKRTRTPGLDILPASVELADATDALSKLIGREARLRAALADVEPDYDFIVVDSSPTRSVLTVNVLVAVREVYIPIEPGLFSLSGLGQIQAAIEDVRRYLGNGVLKIAGLVLTRTRNDGVSRDVEAQLRATFGALVCTATVPSSVKVEEAHGRFQSVLDYAPRSNGAKAYESLVAEIVDHGREKSRTGAPPGGAVATVNPGNGRRAG